MKNEAVNKFFNFFHLIDEVEFILNMDIMFEKFSIDELFEISLYLYKLIKKDNLKFDKKTDIEKLLEIRKYIYEEMEEDVKGTGLKMFITGLMRIDKEPKNAIYQLTYVIYTLSAQVMKQTQKQYF